MSRVHIQKNSVMIRAHDQIECDDGRDILSLGRKEGPCPCMAGPVGEGPVSPAPGVAGAQAPSKVRNVTKSGISRNPQRAAFVKG